MMLDRPVTVWRPNVKRRGRIYQITSRMNNKTNINTLDVIDEIMAFCRAKSYPLESVGIVTHKDARKDFEESGFTCLHFYGQRGTNKLADVRALFVVGAPQPHNDSLVGAYRCLSDDYNPLTPEMTESGIRPVRTGKLVSYNYRRDDGCVPHRMVSGYWWHGIQSLLNAYRESEIIQAVFRARPLTRDVDIYLLTSVPTSLRLDGIGETFGDLMGSPVPNWQAWELVRDWIETLPDGEIIDYTRLAEVTGLKEPTLRKQRWLDLIICHMPGVEALQARKRVLVKT
ncbi:MAG: hypothetical protein D6706_21210 [Chloroflexi bacterium]|nr:MAG: hypothetical protein D6706_21210 [Chloroflexota bacterium]